MCPEEAGQEDGGGEGQVWALRSGKGQNWSSLITLVGQVRSISFARFSVSVFLPSGSSCSGKKKRDPDALLCFH
jgi:hypothetical protein